MFNNPDDLSVLMAYAEANLRKGNRLEAMKAYQKVIGLKPEVSDVRIALAKIYFSMNNHKDAFAEVASIFRIDSSHIEAHLLLKKLHRVTGIPEELNDTLEEHLSFTASPKKIRIMQKLYEMEKKKYARLIEDYDQQLEEDEGSPIVMYNRTKAEERVKFAEETLMDLTSMIGEDEEEETIPIAQFQVPEPGDSIPAHEDESEYTEDSSQADYFDETTSEEIDEINPQLLKDTAEEADDDSMQEHLETPSFNEFEETIDEESLSLDTGFEDSQELAQEGTPASYEGSDEEESWGTSSQLEPETSGKPDYEKDEDDYAETQSTDTSPSSDEFVPHDSSLHDLDELDSAGDTELPDLPGEIEDVSVGDILEGDETISSAEMPEEMLFESTDSTPILSRSQEILAGQLSGIEQIPLENIDAVINEVQVEGETIEVELAPTFDSPIPPVIDERHVKNREFYQSIQSNLDACIGPIIRTRGVTATFIIDADENIITSASSESVDLKELGKLVVEGIQPLVSWTGGNSRRRMMYWVIEFSSGLMVLYPLRENVYLLVIGRQGANFGAIRFSIEKSSQDLTAIFENQPA